MTDPRETDSPEDPPLDLERDPVVEAYKAGIDRTLLRENLRKSVEERMQGLIELQRLAHEARRARLAEQVVLPETGEAGE